MLNSEPGHKGCESTDFQGILRNLARGLESQWNVFDSEGCVPLGQQEEQRALAQPAQCALLCSPAGPQLRRSLGGGRFQQLQCHCGGPRAHNLSRYTLTMATQLQGKVFFTSQGVATALNKS